MDKQQAFELIKLITSTYQNVDFDTEKTKVWISFLEKGDYELSKVKLDEHIVSNKYAPVISDFLVVIQDKPVEDYSADIAAVQRELNDPVLRKKREEAMKKLREAVQGMNEKVGVSHD